MIIIDWQKVWENELLDDDGKCRWCNEDCDYCRPDLFKVRIDDVEYISDRFLMLRAELAPIPADWPENCIKDLGQRPTGTFPVTEVTVDTPEPRLFARYPLGDVTYKVVGTRISANALANVAQTLAIYDNGAPIGWVVCEWGGE